MIFQAEKAAPKFNVKLVRYTENNVSREDFARTRLWLAQFLGQKHKFMTGKIGNFTISRLTFNRNRQLYDTENGNVCDSHGNDSAFDIWVINSCTFLTGASPLMGNFWRFHCLLRIVYTVILPVPGNIAQARNVPLFWESFVRIFALCVIEMYSCETLYVLC